MMTLSIQILLSRLFKQRFERIHHDDDCWSKYDQEQRWKDEKDEWKDELDGGLGSCFFHLLNALGAKRVGVRAQSLADAGAELFGLNQHGDKVADAVHFGALGQVFPGILAGASGALFQYDDVQFIAELRLGMDQFL